MNNDATLRRFLSTPLPAAAAYLGAMLLLLYVVASSVSSLMSQHADVASLRTMLEQFEGRRPAARGQDPGITGPAGSPFLEGATVTIAGAALLTRVTAAVTRLGGSVLSSQVDLQGNQSKVGFVTIIASCDIDQPGLQKLLYDIEAGMPFLFVDQLVVQAPASFDASGGGKLRILLSVSGQWQGAK
ncbi:MAG: type II secretion system protein M [Bradyrhizobium sp.]|nr:type II secretion system protein M [Bradyrhizobium sp.]